MKGIESVKQTVAVVRWNFLGFYKNPRIILTFLFAFILCFFLSDRALMIAEYYESSMQALEPFIWTFGDATSILLSSLLLILLFIDLPKLTPFTPYMLLRTRKSCWLLAQFFYIFLVTAGYILYVLLVTSLLCMQKTYPGNIWSKTAALFAYSSMGNKFSVPSTVKVMESITPWECSMQMVVLLVCYALTLSFFMFGFLLDPKVLAKILHKEDYEMYQVRRILGWISPLNHATYEMHDFGYDALPSVGQSCIIFLLLLLAVLLCVYRTLKRYNFNSFTGEM